MTDRTVVYRIQADIANLQAKMAQGSASVKKFNADVMATGKSGAQARANLTTLGNAAGVVGAVAAAGLGAAVVASANFDEAMSGVSAATHESTENMKLLREAALQAGADTAFSATEAADGIEQLAKAGVETQHILGGGLTGALDLAAAGELAVGDAAEAAATAMTQFNLAGSDVPHIADLLAAGAGKAQGDVADLVMALKQSGLVAAQTGLSIEETTGALSAFAAAGLLGSDAGTSFKTMLLSLNPRSAKAAELMKELGIQAYDASGQFVGLQAYAGQLQEGLAGLSDEQRNAALQTIFGTDAIRAANVLYQEGAQGIGDWEAKVNDAGYAAETAATRLDNLRGDLEALGGSLETALIGTGDGAQGPLRSLVQTLTDVVNAYNALPGPLKTGTAAVAGFVAVAGGGLWVYSKMVVGINATKVAMTGLGISAKGTAGILTGPWGLAVTAATIGLGAWWSGQVEAKQKAEELTATLEAQTGAITESTRAWIVDELAKSGWLDTAAEIGASGEEVVDAILAGSDAVDEFRTKMIAAADGNSVAGQQTQELTGRMSELASILALGRDEALLKADAMGEDTAATKEATAATQEQTASLKDLVDAMEKQRTAALRNADAQINWRASVLDAKDALKENGKTLNINTRAGQANRQALNGMIEGWNGLTRGQQSAKGAFKSARQEIIDQAVAFGMSREEARKYVDKLIEVPKQRLKNEPEFDDDQARRDIGAYKRELASLDGRVVRSTVINTIITRQQRETGVGGPINPNVAPRTSGSSATSPRSYAGGASATAPRVAASSVTGVDVASVQRALAAVLAGTSLNVTGVDPGRAALFAVGDY